MTLDEAKKALGEAGGTLRVLDDGTTEIVLGRGILDLPADISDERLASEIERWLARTDLS